MASSDLVERFPKGSTVDCSVVRVEPFGVIVALDGHLQVHGLIRPAEWDWPGRLSDLQQAAPPGISTQAQVIGYGDPRHEHRMVYLSRRLILPNPFTEYRKRARVGDWVRGQVKFVTQHEGGVLVALGNGVDGFVPRPELPRIALDLEGFGLLAQDWIEAEIIGFEEEKSNRDERGSVTLSVRALLLRREREITNLRSNDASLQFHPKIGPILENLALDKQLQEIEVPVVPEVVRKRFHRVLVVENDEDVSEALDAALGLLGFDCSRAGSTEKARVALQADHFDLVLLDLNLTREKGFELLGEIGVSPGPPSVLLLTGSQEGDWAFVQERANQFAGILQKPSEIRRLLEILEDLALGREVADDRGFTAGLAQAGIAMRSLTRSPLGSSQPFDFDAALDQLRRDTHADRVVLLGYRPGPIFEVVGGDWSGLGRERQRELEISPIGDLLREGGLVFVPDTGQHKRRFSHLSEVEGVGSFAGIQLSYRDSLVYGLFMMSKKAGQLLSETPVRLESLANILERALMERRLQEVLAENQGLLLTGALASSLLHEVKNAAQRLGPFSTVQTVLAERHAADFGKLTPKELVPFKKSIKGIHDLSEELHSLVTLFRDLVAGGQREQVNLGAALHRIHTLLKPFADQHRVILEDPEMEEKVPNLLISPKLLDQALLNLLLNAVEQTGLGTGTVRIVKLCVRFLPEAPFPIRIEIGDTGPGIHTLHRQRIFEPFFSTKERGTGLGLPISRLFIERLGGKLDLENSVIFMGSIFRIELPREVLS
jgi:signal transduction histidine kinase/ActR/RegA family two-component response regulator